MDCLRPLFVRNPVFKSRRWLIDSDYRQLHSGEPEFIEVPCGKCLNCMKKRQNDWAFRIQAESSGKAGRVFFVTMTMDNDSLHNYYHMQLPSWVTEPRREFKRTGDTCLLQIFEDRKQSFLKEFSKKHVCSLTNDTLKVYTSAASIDKKDLQDYFKRLRKSGLSFTYFACGEYGDKFARSHYHCIFWTKEVFSFEDFKKRIFPYWYLCTEDAFDVKSIDSTISGIPVSKYVAKYSVKRIGFDYKDCLPPFAIMSKDTPIGSSYLTVDNYKQLRTNDTYLVYDKQGTRYSLPRFFRNKVFSESERKRLGDGVKNLLSQIDLFKARSLGMTVDYFKQQKLIHNRLLEKSYFDKLRISRFGYDFEICSKTEI